VKILDIESALPIESYREDENTEPVTQKSKPKLSRSQERRLKVIRKVCKEIDVEHPMTALTALCYSEKLFELDDQLDDPKSSQGLLDCILLASKHWEKHLPNFYELEGTGSFSRWTVEEYEDTEATIWMMMDYCLLPRGPIVSCLTSRC
jgi:hypothetical protein